MKKEAISKILPGVIVMPDLFRHLDFPARILGSRNTVSDDKVFLRWLLLSLFLLLAFSAQAQKRARDYGIKIGVLSTGKLNAITDVAGVKVGHKTLI